MNKILTIALSLFCALQAFAQFKPTRFDTNNAADADASAINLMTGAGFGKVINGFTNNGVIWLFGPDGRFTMTNTANGAYMIQGTNGHLKAVDQYGNIREWTTNQLRIQVSNGGTFIFSNGVITLNGAQVITNGQNSDVFFNNGLTVYKQFYAQPTGTVNQVASRFWIGTPGNTADLAQFMNTNQAKVSGVDSNASFYGDAGGLTNLNGANLVGSVPSSSIPAFSGDISTTAGSTVTKFRNNPWLTNAVSFGTLMVTNTAALAGLNSDSQPQLGLSDNTFSVPNKSIVGFDGQFGNVGGGAGQYTLGFMNTFLNPQSGFTAIAAVPGGGGCVQTYGNNVHWMGMASDNRITTDVNEMWGPNCIGGGAHEFLCRISTNALSSVGSVFCTPLVIDGYGCVSIARPFTKHTTYQVPVYAFNLYDNAGKPAFGFVNGGLNSTIIARSFEADGSGYFYGTDNALNRQKFLRTFELTNGISVAPSTGVYLYYTNNGDGFGWATPPAGSVPNNLVTNGGNTTVTVVQNLTGASTSIRLIPTAAGIIQVTNASSGYGFAIAQRVDGYTMFTNNAGYGFYIKNDGSDGSFGIGSGGTFVFNDQTVNFGLVAGKFKVSGGSAVMGPALANYFVSTNSLTIATTNAAPVNAVSPVVWFTITNGIGGQVYRVPGYQ